MQIGKPLRVIVVDPLEIPILEPQTQPEPAPAPEPEPEPVEAPVSP